MLTTFTIIPSTVSSIYTHATLSLLLLLFFHLTTAALVKKEPLILKYHNGPLLKGKVTVNLIWYGKFTASQRSIIVDFISSLGSTPRVPPPSAASWWHTTSKYGGAGGAPSDLHVGDQILLENYPLGKTLKNSDVMGLGSRPSSSGPISPINIVLTASDVAVEGFCMRCGTHGSVPSGPNRSVYVWVGNSESQCPGECAWPFHQPMYGPQTRPELPPNGDVGIDGMVVNLATLLAGTVTNPFEDGYYLGTVEAGSACTGVFGSGAYPGYPGRVFTDKVKGASYNANGINGRKFLLPAMWDPKTSGCATLV